MTVTTEANTSPLELHLIDDTEAPDWLRVNHCTCAAADIGPGGHETHCGWIENDE